MLISVALVLNVLVAESLFNWIHIQASSDYTAFGNLTRAENEIRNFFEPDDVFDFDSFKIVNPKSSSKCSAKEGFPCTTKRHVCTGRPCNCYVGNCFAYCSWNWCFPMQDDQLSRKYLDCDYGYKRLFDCLDFKHPCSELC